MPKLVDHEAKRREIVHAVLRITKRGGLHTATMREIAAEAGQANGGIAHYFRNKEELLVAAFEHIFSETNRRAYAAIGEAEGLTAVRRLCLEIMPLDEQRIAEARIAVSFWGRAVHDTEMSALQDADMRAWRAQLHSYLASARDNGEVRADVELQPVVDELLATTMGFQANVLMNPEATTPQRQTAVLDAILARLG
ncbi:TetR/AcrR family transcriptional regulator [Sciscionella marina]|uniref:TetR/AcrR family transcriptional regulator n=1 Tax=Sciscionella marina TaxID=508770 RepID=UPI0003800CE2|nr:TetR/AcrR family transcriptional regulator [Sciscionella marina]